MLETSGLQDYGRATVNEGDVEGNEMESVDKSFTKAIRYLSSASNSPIQYLTIIPFLRHRLPLLVHYIVSHKSTTLSPTCWKCGLQRKSIVHALHPYCPQQDTRNYHRVAVCCPDTQLLSLYQACFKFSDDKPVRLIVKDWVHGPAFLTSTLHLILCVGPVCLL
ncbi:hypothetical protein PILCRDRAFT_603359 [Piloderma croceum F 1598]|uniref:Uncharacterized protein n=1 Tax=Piloderma croceum (strain F 1598) TaxID=765440 RepID=A0A0C3F018_PILCF|nr:hypothetical protein PILCRDRAFT_603359 [Piloderma croceum F 1598]